MKTIAYIANAFPSPVEPYVVDEINELRRRGMRVICCSGKRVSLRGLNNVERKLRDETRYLRMLRPFRFLRGLRMIASGWKQVRPAFLAGFAECQSAGQRMRLLAHTLLGGVLANELEPEMVNHIHAHHGYYASWMALIASRLLRIEFSFTLHGSDLLLGNNLLATKLACCHFCVTISRYNRDYILRRFPEAEASKILVQRLGVDLSPSVSHCSMKRESRPAVLLSVGRLHRVKNYEFLIQACAALRRGGLDFQCWIVGDGLEYPKLKCLVRDLQLQDRVFLLGQRSHEELITIYRRADLFILTSRSEGIPLVLMEAMASGTLVLAPEITGIPELVHHGTNGFLYRAGSIFDFLERVRWILDRRFALEDVRQRAVETISAHYNRQRNVADFADHFLARLGEGKDRHENPLLQQVQLSV